MPKDKEKSSVKSTVTATPNSVKSKKPMSTSEQTVSKPATPALKETSNVHKSKELVSSSESEDEDEDSESDSESESESDSASDSSASNSNSDSNSDSESDSDLSTHSQRTKKRNNPNTSDAPSLPPTYSLPSNSIPLETGTNTTNPFTPQSLSGKQLFLITAPSHIPLSALSGTRLPLSALATGESFLAQNSQLYCLRADDDHNDEAEASPAMSLLVPLAGPTQKGRYGVSSVPLSKSLHLTIAPPSSTLTSTRIQSTKKVVRTQPEGLQMRYHPFGAGPKILGENHFGGGDGEGVGEVVREINGGDVDGDITMGGVRDGAGDTSRKRRKTHEGEDGEGKRKKKDKGGKKHKEKS